jgi:hypothetical protein
MAVLSEDQEQELEALQAIYPNELTILSQVPGDVRFSVLLKCEGDADDNKKIDKTNDDSDDDDDVVVSNTDKVFSVSLEFILPEEYPNDVPSILIQDRSDNILTSDEEELLSLLNEEAKQNLGMVMVFTLIQIGSEWLNRRKDEDEARKKELEERRLREIEEAENKKFEGTRVTVESFLKWKEAFDEEMNEIKRKNKEKESTKRLTGRELFEKDKTLNESDLKFLEDDKDVSYDDQGVKVDTSLFDDEDVDDEDYDPDEDDDE